MRLKGLVLATALASLLLWAGSVGAQGIDTAMIEQVTGLKGAMNKAGDVFKVSAPRTDVKITVDGLPLPPFMGVTSWAAFQDAGGGQLLMMGDMVLFEDEVNPAMSAALNSGLQVTALHNHFFYDKPKVYLMHIGGQGSPDALAGRVRKILDTAKQIRQGRPEPAASFGGPPLPTENAITPQPIEAILGSPSETKDGMVKVTIGRQTSMHGTEVGKDMGVNTWAAFAGTDGNAVVDGDFAITEDELQPVLRTLRQAGINIVAIHNHMTHEDPRILFLHYWGRGKAEDLARAVKAALDQTKG